jgi:hypothetical protein
MTDTVIDPFVAHLDDLQTRRNLSDAELTLLIGLPSLEYISKIRCGEKIVPTNVKFKVWSLLGRTWNRDDMLVLLPEKFRATLNAIDPK